ncbi:hypothetical protein ACS0TY_035986 [Phlomoides rotata]
MPLLRHVELNSFFLPDPPNAHIVLGNLQTLSSVRISQCHKEVVERISNVKKLRISCEESDTDSLLCFNNLSHLHKLEHLSCYFDLYLFPINLILEETLRSELQRNVAFPCPLKKLTLFGCQLHWEYIATTIGPLPLLQVLKLKTDSFIGPDWVTVEGQFCSLKFLLIDFCDNLVRWTTDDTHFPRLEHLRLKRLDKLTEIPLSIGDIPTLQSIELERCSYSAIMSAKRIVMEQEELGNEGLRVEIKFIANTTVPTLEIEEILDTDWCTSQFRDDVLEKVGVLPRLEKLKLMYGSFRRRDGKQLNGNSSA